MRRKKNKLPKRQRDTKLFLAHDDDITLGYAVEQRMQALSDLWLRTTGERLCPPEVLRQSFQRFWAMRRRHVLKDDFRATRLEIEATREIAQWLVNTKAALCSKAPVHLDWEDYGSRTITTFLT